MSLFSFQWLRIYKAAAQACHIDYLCYSILRLKDFTMFLNRGPISAVALALLLPAMVVLALQFSSLRSEREKIEKDAIFRAQEVNSLAELKIESHLKAMKMLATSPIFQEGRWERADERINDVLSLNPSWKNVIVSDGRRIVHALHDFRRGEGAQFAKQAAEASAVGGIDKLGPGCPCIYLHTAVTSRGKSSTLSIAIDPAELQQLVLEWNPSGSVTAIVDRNGNFVARSLNYEKMLGLPASHYLRDAVKASSHGFYQGVTLEGMENFTGFRTSSLTGWSAHVAVPSSVVERPIFWSSLIAGLGVMAAMVAAAALIVYILREYEGATAARMAAIIESTDDAIISKDLNGVIISWNPAATQILGYSSQEAVGKHISLIIPPERLSEEEDIIGRIRRGERLSHFETVRMTKSGQYVNLSITVSPVKNRRGKIIGASKVARDVTDRIRTELQLAEERDKAEAANRAKSEFLATMSHEIRTPMNAIIGLSNILSMSDLSPRQHEYINTLRTSADALLSLLNDLLDISKIESSAIQYEQIPFSLAQLAREVFDMVSVRAREKGLRLSLETSTVENMVFVSDPTRLRQVIANLCGNAVKFTEQGEISLTVAAAKIRPGSTTVTITVRDTGIGIEKDQLQSIFEKFIQADSSISRKYGGSGLGLAITKGIVESLNGEITVDSDPGRGSSFVVTLELPLLSDDRPASMLEEPGAPASENVKAGEILLVEDYEPNILVATSYLEDLGFSYHAVRTGREAIDTLETRSFDAVFMDIQMPGMDGLEATRRIRESERRAGKKRVKIIGVTAHAMVGDRERCLEAGMDDYLTKPYTPADLQKKLNRVLQPGQN